MREDLLRFLSRNRTLISTTLVLLANLIAARIVLSYGQHAENAHMSAKYFLSFLLSVIAMITLARSLFVYQASGSRAQFFNMLIMGLSLFFWAWKAFHLQCQGCLISG